jgi:hypothetical protein
MTENILQELIDSLNKQYTVAPNTLTTRNLCKNVNSCISWPHKFLFAFENY